MRARRAQAAPAAALAALLWVGCGGPSEPVDPPVPCEDPTDVCLRTLRVGPGDGAAVQAYATHSLADGSPEVTRAVIVIHGTNRDADAYFESMLAAVRAAGGTPDTILVVSPWFKTEDDGPASGDARWTSGGWKRGHLSTGPNPRTSSYSVLDELVRLAGDPSRFPALGTVVVAGHSAGGQVVHRYAATGRAEDELTATRVRYAPANPSTWLYLGPERWDGTHFEVPGVVACPDYDDWHYGLGNRNTYASIPVDSIRARLVRRDVQVLLGDADTGSVQLDVTCGANLQGATRYQRGLTLLQYMDARYPDHAHVGRIVEGVGHSSRAMFTAPVGREALFPS